ncbi:MAG: nicotinate-nicotinamide nucleotide adenylyltransferase, partial [Vibrio sp.]
DEVLLVPSFAHAWGKNMLEFDTRAALIDVFLQDLQREGKALNAKRSSIEASIWENLPDQSAGVTTYALLDHLSHLMPDAALTFVLGPDNLLSFGRFYRSDDILARWSILACPQTLAVRSTDIRDHLSQNKPQLEALHGLTTPQVAQYLITHDLYQN